MTSPRRAARFARLWHIPPQIQTGRDPLELARVGEGLHRLRVPQDTLRRQLAIVGNGHVPLLVVSGDWSAGMEATADAVAAAGGGERAVIPFPHHFPHFADAFNERLDIFMRQADSSAHERCTMR